MDGRLLALGGLLGLYAVAAAGEGSKAKALPEGWTRQVCPNGHVVYTDPSGRVRVQDTRRVHPLRYQILRFEQSRVMVEGRTQVAGGPAWVEYPERSTLAQALEDGVLLAAKGSSVRTGLSTPRPAELTDEDFVFALHELDGFQRSVGQSDEARDLLWARLGVRVRAWRVRLEGGRITDRDREDVLEALRLTRGFQGSAVRTTLRKPSTKDAAIAALDQLLEEIGTEFEIYDRLYGKESPEVARFEAERRFLANTIGMLCDVPGSKFYRSPPGGSNVGGWLEGLPPQTQAKQLAETIIHRRMDLELLRSQRQRKGSPVRTTLAQKPKSSISVIEVTAHRRGWSGAEMVKAAARGQPFDANEIGSVTVILGSDDRVALLNREAVQRAALLAARKHLFSAHFTRFGEPTPTPRPGGPAPGWQLKVEVGA